MGTFKTFSISFKFSDFSVPANRGVEGKEDISW